MNKQINVVSLFSGIGGFEEGLKLANINSKIVLASEIDSFAKKSYIANFGDENLHGDIKLVDEKDVPDHTLLLAGFPCQSFSIAGKRKGFEDIRGTLFFEVARILSEKKPKYILLENVKNLISHDGTATIRTILNTLNEIGYSVDFTVLNSSEAGVPQNRDRTYICGIYNGKIEKYLPDNRSVKADKLKKELNETDFKGFNFFDGVSFKNKQKCIEDILQEDVDATFFFDTEKISEYLDDVDVDEDIVRQTRIIKIIDLPREVHNDLERQRRVYSVKGISPTVLARADSTKILVTDSGKKKIRKITPVENFYIQGFSKEFVCNIRNTGMSATQMYKQSGNAVSPPVIAGILEKMYKEYMAND
ncbi:DNA (cytosine-5-)-methyltransferase [Acetoanaerobium noterae]|uniref:DNA (cytosine-5-)-methyltransferase n=1 Tax=Acetoanaerobium noterae TaxID=745369 RepID=UPI003341E3BB